MRRGKAGPAAGGREWVVLRASPLLAALLAGGTATGAVAEAGPAAGAAAGLNGVDACVARLTDAAAERVSCRVDYVPSPPERAELARLTGGVLTDANCELAVDVARGPLFEALLRPEVFEVPPQDGSCRVATGRGPLDVAFAVAPRVRFADGRAVAATPNLHAVRGLPELLAIVLAEALNRSPVIEAAMLREINGFLERMER